MRVDEAEFTGSLLTGWATANEGSPPLVHRWTVESRAQLLVPVPPQASRPTLTMRGIPFIAEGLVPFQDVWVFAEGALVSFGRLTGPGVIDGTVPGWVMRPGSTQLLVTLVVPNAVVPAGLGLGDDQRALGFALQEITIAP